MNMLKQLPLKRLMKVGKLFWLSDKRKAGYTLLFIVLGLLAGQTLVLLFINTTTGHFFTAIEKRSLYDFYYYLFAYVMALFVTTPLQVNYGFYRTRLSLCWRDWLSRHFFEMYFAPGVFGKLIKHNEIDHPEQRITNDLDSFCNSSVGLFISMLEASTNVVIFSFVLWKLSPVLFWTVLIYSSLGVVVVAAIGKGLPGLTARQIEFEADLRSNLTLDLDADHVVVGDRVSLHTQSLLRLDIVISTWIGIAKLYRSLQIFTTGFNLLVPLIPAVITAPLYFNGSIEFGTITQAVMAFTVVFNGATVLISQYGGISALSAITNRLGSLLEEMTSYRNHSLVELSPGCSQNCLPVEEPDREQHRQQV